MTIDTFIQQLQDVDLKTRLRAIYQLGIIGDSNALPALEHIGQNDPSVEIRPAAQAAIQHIQNTSQMDTVKDAQADLDWTQSFIYYLQTNNMILTPEDIADLAKIVEGASQRILQEHAQSIDSAPANPAKPTPKVVQTGKGTTEAVVGTYQMLWDCDVCNTKKLLGVTHRHCPNCGSAQSPDARYFPEPGEEIALHDHQYVGKDIICPACDGLNSAAATYCGNCGANMKDGTQATTREDQHESEFGENKRDLVQEQFQADMLQAGVLPKPDTTGFLLSMSKKTRYIVGGVVAFILLVCGIGGFVTFYKQSETVTVAAHNWERTIEIEEFRALDQHKDCDDMPSDAYSVDRSTESRTRRVADGQTCTEQCSNKRVDRGDGSFDTVRECRDVCETKYKNESYTVQVCDYTVNRWSVVETVRADGDGLSAAWPALILADSINSEGLGGQRAGDRNEVYVLEIKRASGKQVECEFDDEDVWRKYADGESFELAFNVLGQPACDDLK